VNAVVENDEVSLLRLKAFVEKLDAEKTEVANKLHEEQRSVWKIIFGWLWQF